MATKTPRKRRSAKDLDVIHIGPKPKWHDIDSIEHPEYMERVRMALRHYGYFNSVKDFHKDVVKWASENINDPGLIKLYKKAPDWRTPMTVCSLVAAANEGMPMKPEFADYIIGKIKDAAETVSDNNVVGDTTDNTKALKKAPNIQERIIAKANEHILHFEETYEDGIIERKEKHPKPEVIPYLKKHNVPATTVNHIILHFEAQKQEIVQAHGKEADPQLKEAYSHLKRADFKRFLDFYNALLKDLSEYRDAKKVEKKPRMRKPQPKGKIVAKLKYMKKHEELGLVSIDPKDIIDAKVLWVYNTKTRKLGRYVAGDLDTLSVKGTSIVGFDPTKSIAKTLRKPKQQLAQFKKAGKVKLRKFLDEIKAVDIKLTGRINADTILLNAY